MHRGSLYKLPFQYFLGLGCHIGTVFHLWSVESSPNVLFKTSIYPIINITSTSFNCVSAARFIRFCASRNLKPLFFLARAMEMYLAPEDGLWKIASYLVNYWFPGLLTNFKFVFKKSKFKTLSSALVRMPRYPDFLVFLDTRPRTLRLASSESRSARMPSIGLSDVDFGPAIFNYSIFSNSKSFVMSYNFYKLFACSVFEGANSFTKVIAAQLVSFYNSRLQRGAALGHKLALRRIFYPFSVSIHDKLQKLFPVEQWIPFLSFASSHVKPNMFLSYFSHSVLVFPKSEANYKELYNFVFSRRYEHYRKMPKFKDRGFRIKSVWRRDLKPVLYKFLKRFKTFKYSKHRYYTRLHRKFEVIRCRIGIKPASSTKFSAFRKFHSRIFRNCPRKDDPISKKWKYFINYYRDFVKLKMSDRFVRRTGSKKFRLFRRELVSKPDIGRWFNFSRSIFAKTYIFDKVVRNRFHYFTSVHEFRRYFPKSRFKKYDHNPKPNPKSKSSPKPLYYYYDKNKLAQHQDKFVYFVSREPFIKKVAEKKVL